MLQMLQGFCSDLFYWDEAKQGFLVKDGIYASHLSQTSLKGILNIFLFAGTCLKRVEIFVTKVGSSGKRTPTLSAFANSVYSWLKVCTASWGPFTVPYCAFCSMIVLIVMDRDFEKLL